jgi:hypothetical protein
LRRAGHVERIDADHWKIPEDIAERGTAYDAPSRPKDFGIRALSTLDLLTGKLAAMGPGSIGKLVAKDHLPLAGTGFGREVNRALDWRTQRLVDLGHATAKDDFIDIPRRTVAVLQRQEVERIGRQMAAERGLTYTPSVPANLAGVATLASGRFAMMEDGLGFQLVPWQPILEKQIGKHISGVMRYTGGIDWDFGRKRGLGV